MSTKTIQRHMDKNTQEIKEGFLNIDGLKQYLVSNGFPLAVAISEDGTRITPAVEYDYKDDSLRGLVAPLDGNGLPLKNIFAASSAKKMKDDIDNYAVANYVYVVMATPLSPDAAPFVLYHACTDNRFTADDVLKRWKLEETLLQEAGIEVVARCSDGDPRLMKAMKMRSGLDQSGYFSPLWGKYYVVQEKPKVPPNSQDTTHELNKFKNSLIKRDMLIGT